MLFGSAAESKQETPNYQWHFGFQWLNRLEISRSFLSGWFFYALWYNEAITVSERKLNVLQISTFRP